MVSVIFLMIILSLLCQIHGFPDSSVGKESSWNAGDSGSIPGLGRSPGEGKGYPLQYSGLENSIEYIVMGLQRVRHNWATCTFTNIKFNLPNKQIDNIKFNLPNIQIEFVEQVLPQCCRINISFLKWQVGSIKIGSFPGQMAENEADKGG